MGETFQQILNSPEVKFQGDKTIYKPKLNSTSFGGKQMGKKLGKVKMFGFGIFKVKHPKD